MKTDFLWFEGVNGPTNTKEMIIMRKNIKKWSDGDSGVFTNGTRFRLNYNQELS